MTMNNIFFDFKTLYIAVAVKYENRYLTYIDPVTRDISLFFYKMVAENPGKFSYEEVLQKARILLETTFVLPSVMFTELDKMTLLQQLADEGGNVVLCLTFSPNMDIEDVLSIKMRGGNTNFLSFLELDEVTHWEFKDKYTEKLIPLLRSKQQQ